MTYELENLNTIIYSNLEDFFNQETLLEPDDFSYWVSTIAKESNRIKNAFIKVAFGNQDERQIERYMSHHQVDLIRLTDHLLQYLEVEKESVSPDQKPDWSAFHLCKELYAHLESLLSYLETHFTRYFNIEATVPATYKSIAKRELKDKFVLLVDRFHNINAAERLIKVVTYPIHDLISDKARENFSFRQLIYLKLMVKELEKHFSNEHEFDDMDQQLMCTMIYINFNSYNYFAYCTQYITSKYQNKETLTDQIDHLAWTSKVINQAQQKPEVAYQPNRESLKHTLIAWIDEEVAFLEKRHQLSLNMVVNKTDESKINFKLNTSMSVAQLAYFIRILLEEKIIINRNQREVLKFFAQFTRTKKAENVSPESLRTRFYNVEASTKDAVKDVIIRLLNHIRKNS